MSSSRVSLCEHILMQDFGSAVGLVGSVLLSRGRLSYSTLLRLVPRTLSQRVVMASILVLVQHNCLYHFLDEEDGQEYFETNLAEILQRRKFGTYLSLSRELWGKRGLDIVSRVLVEGKIQLATLIADCEAANRSPLEYKQSVKLIYDLLDCGVLRVTTRANQTSTNDQDMQYEKQLLRALPGPPGPKDLRNIKVEVMQRRQKIEAELPDWGSDPGAYEQLCEEIEQGSQEKPDFYSRNGNGEEAAETTSSSKKRKSMTERSDYPKSKRLSLPFNDKVYVRVVPTLFDIRIRNDLIVRAVRGHSGGAAAVLVSAILNETVGKQETLNEELSDYVNGARLVDHGNRKSPVKRTVPLPGEPRTNGHSDLADHHSFYTLFPRQPVIATYGLESSGYWRLENKEPIELISEVLHSLNNTYDARDKLLSLADRENQDDYHDAQRDRTIPRANGWLACSDETTLPGFSAHALEKLGWAVDFQASNEMLRMALLQGHIKKKFGKEAFRVWRILDEKGPMEEKHIAKLVLLPAKEVREKVAALSSAGFLMQQDIPRSADRNPSRAIFLMLVSRSNCYQVLLSQLYETLVNLRVRMEAERDACRPLIRKSERSDVRKDPSLLDKADQEDLRTLEWKMESMAVAAERIDRDIFILETLPTSKIYQ